MIRTRALWILLPPIVLCLLDFGLTLYGQSDAYWSGNYSAFNEMSPSFGQYLSIHPLVFVAAGIVWIGLFSTLIVILPEQIAMTLAVCVVIGHMLGAFSWLAYRFQSYQTCNALSLVTAALIVTSFNMGRSGNGQGLLNWTRTGLPSWTRWAFSVLLAVIPVWWFLVPR
jgi:hypothetical protein